MSHIDNFLRGIPDKSLYKSMPIHNDNILLSCYLCFAQYAGSDCNVNGIIQNSQDVFSNRAVTNNDSCRKTSRKVLNNALFTLKPVNARC